MDDGQVPVEHEHVVADDSGFDERLLTVRREIDRETLPPKPTSDRVSEAEFVFGDQDAHRKSMTTHF
jgi:hypothetical protein